MKLIRTSIVIFTAAFFLSSCGSLSVSKKRYSRGLNIDWFSSRDDAGKSQPIKKKERVSKSVQNNSPAKTGAIAEESGVYVFSETEPIENLHTDLALTDYKPLINEKEINRKISKHKEAGKVTFLQKMAAKKIGRVVRKHTVISPETNQTTTAVHASHDADTNLILLVILALLLPPLAIFLYFGELEVHFLINILLILLGGGLWLASGGISYIGLAVIHALLVVFGIFG